MKHNIINRGKKYLCHTCVCVISLDKHFFLFFYCKFPSQFSRYGVKHWKINQQTRILFNLCLIVNITTHVIQLVIFTYSDFIPCVHDPPPLPQPNQNLVKLVERQVFRVYTWYLAQWNKQTPYRTFPSVKFILDFPHNKDLNSLDLNAILKIFLV